MIVYTMQGYDLRKFQGQIDKRKGTYSADVNVMVAMDNLYNTVGTDQAIWCMQRTVKPKDYHAWVGYRYLHEINLDEMDVLAIIDTFIWQHILYPGENYVPEEIRRDISLRVRGQESGGNDVLRNNAIEKLKRSYIAENLPADLWSSLILRKSKSSEDQFLLRHPIRFSRIKVTDTAEAT